MNRRTIRAFQGGVLSIGAPLGWLLVQWTRGVGPVAALGAQPALFLYLTFGTLVVFGGFGHLLGRREEELLAANRRLEDLSVTDALTGLRNTRYYEARLTEEFAEAARADEPLAIVALDLDRFKAVNDRYGHLVGDEVLKAAASAILSVSREGETLARVGGEEFAILLPGADAARGREAAERVRAAIANHPAVVNGRAIRVTASAGVSSTAEHPRADPVALHRAADDALYRAKDQGRDRTVVG